MYIKNHSFCQGERKRFLILVQEPDLEIKTHLARKGKAEEGGGQWSNDQRGLRSTPHWLHKTFSFTTSYYSIELSLTFFFFFVVNCHSHLLGIMVCQRG